MALSRTMHQEFTQNANNVVQGMELTSIQVLTNGNWPIDEQLTCNIPRTLTLVTEKFERYYHNKFNNRKLRWLNQFGTVDMQP